MTFLSPVARNLLRVSAAAGLVFLLACLLVGGGSLAAVWLGPGLLARRSFLFSLGSGSSRWKGIEAPPEQDGRLLGHFPYDEAIASQLVPVEGWY
jgi:D-alanyl-D-alanine carboxypeptidase